MSDIDPTPETPVTIGDRLGWWRGALDAQLAALRGTPASDLAALATALTALRGTPASDLAAVAAAVAALRGTPASDLAAVAAAVAALRGANNATLSSLLTESQFDTQSQLQNGILLDVQQVLDDIKTAIGTPTGDATTTALGYLSQIARQTYIAVSGLPPSSSANDTGSAGDDVISGRRYAKFYPPITGVTIAANGYDITATWTGWRAYIQTTAPQIKIATATDVPNTWLPLTGTGTINFSVDAQYPIYAALRAPVSGAVLVNSTYFPAPKVWAALITGYTSNSNGELTGNGAGHSWKFEPGTGQRASGGPGNVGDPRIYAAISGGEVRKTGSQITIDQWYHFANPTTLFTLYSYLGAFTVRWSDSLQVGSIAL